MPVFKVQLPLSVCREWVTAPPWIPKFEDAQIQFSSFTQLCLTLCDPMGCSTLGFPVHHNSRSSLKLMCIESVMPFNHLILCRPLLLLLSIFPTIRVFSELAFHIRWPKYWSFSFRNPRVDLLRNRLAGSPCSPRDSQESSPAPHFESINSLVFSLLYCPTLTSVLEKP